MYIFIIITGLVLYYLHHKEHNFKFRESSYFNEKDFYIFNNNLCFNHVSKAILDKNGNWYLGNYKATTVKCRKRFLLDNYNYFINNKLHYKL